VIDVSFPADVRRRTGRRRPLAALGLLACLFAAGCGDDGGDDGGLSHDERQVRNAGITFWRQLDTALLANTAALDYGAGGLGRAPERHPVRDAGRLPRTPRPAHLYGINCPDVVPLPNADRIVVYVVYGDSGCVADLTGVRHRGNVALDVTPSLRSGVLTANDWTTGAYRVNGTIGATYQDTMVTIDARALMVSSPDGSVTVTSCLGIWWSSGGTRDWLFDDSWRILGTANVNTLSLESGAIYQVEVDDAAPILANSRCTWPVSGRIAIDRLEPPLAATFDFGDGTCDSKATLTVAGRTTTIDLEPFAD
jgi:hypothetical protein